MISLFNSLSSDKDDFRPFMEGVVRIFICGPTLYDYTHVGHARIFLVYDLLCNHLRERGYGTDVLVNMTDINQNVFHKAKLESQDYHSMAMFYAGKFAEDLSLLNIKTMNRLAFVSDYVEYMERHISQMLKDKVAYSANGNVYLDTSRIETYGILSKQSRKSLLLHRLDVGPNKKHQEDIMLWNCSEDFDFVWPSRLGRGVPWWHMQDTIVALENFGANYDIHGGARELVYPHHEAHLAQYGIISKSKNPVKVWMHVGLVLSKGEKISKSLGNVTLSRDMVQRYGKNLLRLYMFSKHYRQDFEFDESKIVEKKPLLELAYLANMRTSEKSDPMISKMVEEFLAALDDDLNSPRALEIFEKICSSTLVGGSLGHIDFERLCRILGITI